MRPSRSRLVGVVALVAGCPGTRTTGTPACPMDRTVLITGQDDVKDHAACTALSSLTIRSGAALDLSALRALTSITGDLQIGPTVGMEELQLP